MQARGAPRRGPKGIFQDKVHGYSLTHGRSHFPPHPTQKCDASIGTAPLYWRKGCSIQEERPLFGVSSPLCGRKKGRATDEAEYGFPF